MLLNYELNIKYRRITEFAQGTPPDTYTRNREGGYVVIPIANRHYSFETQDSGKSRN